MQIRNYQAGDLAAVTELFYNTVHSINSQDYSPRQLDAWADGRPDLARWHQTLTEHYSIVAVSDGVLTGFGDIDESGYLDRLYVHRDYQRQGIATALCDELENHCKEKPIIVHASITARPFFEKRGYQIIAEQQVRRRGIFLTNFKMVKITADCR